MTAIVSEQPVLPADTYLSWAEIDLEAVSHNFRLLKSRLSPATELFSVIKADAYGHGAVAVARALSKEGATQFCVARVEEAVELRQAGITQRVLVLCPPFLPQALVAAEYDLQIVVADPVHIEAVRSASRQAGRSVAVHIKTDVGMGRLGVPPADVAGLINLCDQLGVPVEGLMAHLPCADAASASSSEPMVNTFTDLTHQLADLYPGRKFISHVANSAASMRMPEARLDAVRCGIALYGQFPSVEMEREYELRPAMTVKSRIAFLKQVEAGTPISYSHTYRTGRPSRLATIPLGYADGYPRQASNNANFIVRGKLVPQVGRVCMDHVILDVTDVPGVQLGDVAIAFGKGQGMVLRAEDVAAQFDSIGYELTTRIGKRLPRFITRAQD